MSIEQYSFFDLLEKYGQIEIPALQRDYAQGRNDEKEVRTSFLHYLHNLITKKQKDTLDFIYGVIDKNLNKLILIDGQQRITTIMLLHWFLAVKEGSKACSDFYSHMSDNNSSRFIYNTRPASRDFSNALVRNTESFAYDDASSEALSSCIINQKWFLPHWHTDSTVNAMLVMLDALQKEFAGENTGLYSILTDDKVIQFDFMNLDDFSEHDAGRLYIKMNSRGKPLTRFENIKSLLIGRLEKHDGLIENQMSDSFIGTNSNTDALSFAEKIAWSFDVRWTDAFWNCFLKLGDDKYKEDWAECPLDNFMLNLLVLPVIYECCIAESKIDKNFITEHIETNASSIPYDDIFRALDEYDNDGKILSGVFNFLNSSTEYDTSQAKWTIKAFDVYSWLNYGDESYFISLMKKLMDKDEEKLDLADRLRLFALFLYFSQKDKPSYSLKQWLRFSMNIIEGTIFQGKNFFNSVDSLKKLYSDFSSLTSFDYDMDKYPGLDSDQIEEELKKISIEKADSAAGVLILDWEERLYPYFNGQMRYPLFVSGFWNGDYSLRAKEKFISVCNSLFALFVGSDESNHLDYSVLLGRALLTRDDYMLSVGNTGVKSFLIMYDRDYSWKRYLKNTEKATAFTSLISDSRFSSENIENSLQVIIASARSNIYPLWKYILISNSAIWKTIRYFGDENESPIWIKTRNIYVEEKENSPEDVYIFKGKNREGRQSELYSIDLYTKLKDIDVAPFKDISYYRADFKDDVDHSCVVFSGWNSYAINIYRVSGESKIKFAIRFFDENTMFDDAREKLVVCDELKNILENKLFFTLESEGYIWKIKRDGNEVKVIRDFLAELNQVVLT